MYRSLKYQYIEIYSLESTGTNLLKLRCDITSIALTVLTKMKCILSLTPIPKNVIDRLTESQQLSAYVHWLQTQKHFRQVELFAALGKAEPLISTAEHQKFDLNCWPWPRPLTLILKWGNGDVKTWPTTLTFKSSLPWVKVDLLTKNEGRRPNSSNRRAREKTHKQTERWTLPSPLSPCFVVNNNYLCLLICAYE